jgi:hypothetical protein
MTSNHFLRSFLIIVLLVVPFCWVSSGCGGSYTNPAPCNPAFSCVGNPISYQSPLCPPYPGIGQGQANGMYRTGDANRNRGLYATFMIQDVPYNQPGASTVTYYQSFVIPVGSTVDLGCQFKQSNPPSDNLSQFFFTAVSACFTDTNDCTPPTEVAQRPPNSNCFQSQANCIVFDLSALPDGPEKQAATIEGVTILQLMQKKPPITINFGKLFPVSHCSNRNDVTISATGEFEDDGAPCTESFLVQNSTAKAVVVRVPAIVKGAFTQVLGTVGGISFTDTSASPSLEWFDTNNNSLGMEYVQEMDVLTTTGGRPQLKILGNRRFCFVITFPKGSG